MMWDDAVYRNACRLKTQIEDGEYIPEDIKKQIDHCIEMKEEEKSILRKDRIISWRKNKLR
jgi:hypothetical protein